MLGIIEVDGITTEQKQHLGVDMCGKVKQFHQEATRTFDLVC